MVSTSCLAAGRSLRFLCKRDATGSENLVKIMIFVDVWLVLGFLSVVWAVQLGICSLYHINWDSEAESFQKIRGEKFERGQGQHHGRENS